MLYKENGKNDTYKLMRKDLLINYFHQRISTLRYLSLYTTYLSD